jgi:predicted metal-dependent hydrolase
MAAIHEVLQLPRGPTTVQWRRSARARRISLRIDPRNSCVVVTLPTRAGRAAGMALLTDHAAWVADRLAALPVAVAFADGALVPLAGVPHRIRHRPDGHGGAWLEAGEIHVAGDPAFLARRVTDFLRAEARRRLTASVATKSAQAGLVARRVTVKDTRSRWGSCAPDGTVMFCWRLVMAPVLVQDYVVAHEVAHLRHMNHGPRFWGLVAELTEHRDAAVDWLGQHGAGLLRAG